MKKKLNILLILFFAVLSITCKDKETYLVRAEEKRDQHGGIIYDEYTLEYIHHNGAKIYIEFDRLYDRTKQRIEIEFISKEKIKNFHIDSINIQYFDKIEKISVKKETRTGHRELDTVRVPFYFTVA